MTQDLLKELFEYKDGKLLNRYQRKRALKGEVAGYVNIRGYRRIKINSKSYPANRLVYIYHYGDAPAEFQVDHINGKRDDNRIENLRLVTPQENQFNTLAKGYSWDKTKGKFKARIKLNNKLKNIGYFDTAEKAREAYLNAKESLHIIKDRKVA